MKLYDNKHFVNNPDVEEEKPKDIGRKGLIPGYSATPVADNLATGKQLQAEAGRAYDSFSKGHPLLSGAIDLTGKQVASDARKLMGAAQGLRLGGNLPGANESPIPMGPTDMGKAFEYLSSATPRGIKDGMKLAVKGHPFVSSTSALLNSPEWQNFDGAKSAGRLVGGTVGNVGRSAYDLLKGAAVTAKDTATGFASGAWEGVTGKPTGTLTGADTPTGTLTGAPKPGPPGTSLNQLIQSGDAEKASSGKRGTEYTPSYTDDNSVVTLMANSKKEPEPVVKPKTRIDKHGNVNELQEDGTYGRRILWQNGGASEWIFVPEGTKIPLMHHVNSGGAEDVKLWNEVANKSNEEMFGKPDNGVSSTDTAKLLLGQGAKLSAQAAEYVDMAAEAETPQNRTALLKMAQQYQNAADESTGQAHTIMNIQRKDPFSNPVLYDEQAEQTRNRTVAFKNRIAKAVEKDISTGKFLTLYLKDFMADTPEARAVASDPNLPEKYKEALRKELLKSKKEQ